MSMAEKIEAALQARFDPTELSVVDDSEAHRGHAGYQDGGESHFQVVIAAAEFADMTRIARHRAVHAALGPEIMGKIHALALTIR